MNNEKWPPPNFKICNRKLNIKCDGPKHGSTFLTEPKFSGFCMAKIAKFLKNGPSFQEKSLKMGTLSIQTIRLLFLSTSTWPSEMPDFRIYSEFRIFSLPISTVLFIFSPFWVNLSKFTHFFRIFEWHSLAPLLHLAFSDCTFNTESIGSILLRRP